MEREILFRGKNIITNEWVYGDLVTSRKSEGLYYINDGKYDHSVIPESVGQFTGLVDKNGVNIYEGDVVKFQEYENLSWDEESFKLFSLEERKGKLRDHYISQVYWEEGNFLFNISETCQCCLSACFGNQLRQNPIMVFEIIGNIHDNPEFIK